MKRIFLILLFPLTVPLFALDITLAEIEEAPTSAVREEYSVLYDEISRDLYKQIGSYDPLGCLVLNKLDKSVKVNSLLSASTTAYNNQMPYMLYGSYYESMDWLELRISLYEQETDRIRTTFFGKASKDRYDSLIDNTAERIGTYFYDQYNIEAVYAKDPWEGYWELGMNLGYWMILPSWNDALTGTGTANLHGALALSEPSFRRNHWIFYPKFGLSLGYAFAMSTPDYESSLYHSFQMAMPLEFCAEWRRRHCLSFHLTPGDQLDWMAQSRLYNSSYSAISQSFYLSTGFSYRFVPKGGKWAFGMSHLVDITFYDDTMFAYKPSFTIEKRFLREKKND
ncbi:MAG: hypothetical protein PQJ59_09670 [Spirochaetales bacterium]|nr:hypothetical protein [Spirochaetales bacterium]